MSLAAYRRKKEAIKGEVVELSKGNVKVTIREWGSPQFYEAMVPPGVARVPSTEEDQKQEEITRAMAYWVIAQIDDDGTIINDPEEILSILKDPLMWEFKMEVMQLAVEGERWIERPEHLKNLQTSSSKPRSGDESTQKKVRAIQG